jgi:hypothetical protein
MSYAARIADLFRQVHSIAAVRFVLYSALGIVIWTMPMNVIQDSALALAAIIMLRRHWRSGPRVWLNPPGIAFVLLGVYSLAMLPFSQNPGLSASETVKSMDLFTFAFALSVFVDSRRKADAIALYIASSFTLLFALDLVRLVRTYGSRVLERAHYHEPFMLFHPNVQSVAAGVAASLLVYLAWRWRGRALREAFCLTGIAVNLAYLVVLASRGPQLAFAGVIGLSGLILVPGWKRKAAVAAAGLGALTLLVSVNPRFSSTGPLNLLGSRSAMREWGRAQLLDRDKVWAHTWKLSLRRPLFGHGTGKRNFQRVYHSVESAPPASRFHFAHPHQYWLFVFFSQGLVGVALHAAAWGLLLSRLLKRLGRVNSVGGRLFMGLLAMDIIFIFIYSLADWPSAALEVLLIFLAAIALGVTREDVASIGLNSPAEALRPGPQGRILAVVPFNGGVGGIERLTRAFRRLGRDFWVHPHHGLSPLRSSAGPVHGE